MTDISWDDQPGLHAVVVTSHGEPVREHYGAGDDTRLTTPLGHVRFTPGTRHDLRSVTKSITALVYGIALAEHKVPAPTEPLRGYFPEYADLFDNSPRADLTVSHALTMSMGLQWREDIPYDGPANAEVAMELAPDRYRYILERPVDTPPGDRWTYCGGATALLGKLIADGAGEPLPVYAARTLFTPLGIAGFDWMAGADGVPSAASGLRLTAPDLARLGYLLLSGGGGVVPRQWITDILRPRLTTDWGGAYGYHWYTEQCAGETVHFAAGNGGQRLYVVPSRSLVVAVLAGNYDQPDQWRPPLAVLESVLGLA